jgi:hypothetical protein
VVARLLKARGGSIGSTPILYCPWRERRAAAQVFVYGPGGEPNARRCNATRPGFTLCLELGSSWAPLVALSARAGRAVTVALELS